MSQNPHVVIYTDGACYNNPGPGGWAAILIYNDIQKEISGFEPNTTNNQMEMKAIIMGLSSLKRKCVVDVYSDSAYIVNAFKQNWIDNWIEKGWKTSSKKAVKNIELWKKLISLTEYHKVTFHKVKGHSDDELNNRCDRLAKAVIDENTS